MMLTEYSVQASTCCSAGSVKPLYSHHSFIVQRSRVVKELFCGCRVDEASVDPTAQKVYTINCLSAIDHTLAGHRCCSGRSEKLNKQISQQLSALVSTQAGSLLDKSGLAEVAERLRYMLQAFLLVYKSSHPSKRCRV